MRTYKGIVCEINKNMIFMTSEGEFLRGVPTITKVQIGDEVEFHILATSTLPKKRMKTYFIGPALVAAVLLIFFITGLLPNTESAYAYVQVGNEVELAVDEKGTVISVTSLNNDNTIEINGLKGLSLENALTKALVDISPDNNELSITTKYKSREPLSAKEDIEKVVNEVKKENPIKNKSNNSKQKNNENKNNSSHDKTKKDNNGSSNNNGNNGNNGSNNGNGNSSVDKHKNSSNKEQNHSNKNINEEKANSNSKKSDQKNSNQNSRNKNNGNNSNSSKNNSNNNHKNENSNKDSK